MIGLGFNKRERGGSILQQTWVSSVQENTTIIRPDLGLMYEADFRWWWWLIALVSKHGYEDFLLVVVVIVGGSETDYSLSSALPLQPWRPSCHTLWSQENARSTQILSEVQENIQTSNPRPSSRKCPKHKYIFWPLTIKNLKTKEVSNQDILADENHLKPWVDVVFAPNEMWY